jgi:uncharacterized membrane protein
MAPLTPPPRPYNLVRAEFLISQVLRYGMFLCAATIALGLGLRLLSPSPSLGVSSQEGLRDLLQGQRSSSYQVVSSFEGFYQGLIRFEPDTWIAFGLLLLILLPITRVGMTVFLFLIEGDFIFLGITLFVLVVLLFGMIFGKHF